MVYEPSWKEIEDGVSKRIPSENEVLQIVQSKRDIDKVMNTTMSGPHRDKIKFVNDYIKLSKYFVKFKNKKKRMNFSNYHL